MLGPSNYLGRGYQGVPIAITVEGANILTRSLIIFGQGAIRCHPFVLKEMEAAKNPDFNRGLRDFDRYLFGHIGYAFSNAARSFVLALTNAEASGSPVEGPTARYFQHVNRYSAAFALAADVSMLVLGGTLKRKETLSARLGDVFSNIYLASMVLKHFDNQGRQAGDLPLVEWACRTLLYQAQEQLHGFLRNFPNRAVAALLRVCIFPRGRMYSAPSDDLGRELVALITRPTETRARLCDGIYAARQPDSPLGQLQAALEMAERLAPVEARVREAMRAGILAHGAVHEQLEQARERAVITAEEARQLQEFDNTVLAITGVDDFDPAELRRIVRAAALPFHDTAGVVG
jgi:acyl-CoA dehydrogenase